MVKALRNCLNLQNYNFYCFSAGVHNLVLKVTGALTLGARCQNRVLMRKFGPKSEEVTGAW